MVGISVKLDDQLLMNEMQGILDRLDDNRRQLFASIGESLVKSISDNFRGEHEPDGTPWVSLRPATIKARQRGRRSVIKILRDRGHLAGSINYQTTLDELRIGSPVDYAAIHQLGGTIDMPAREQTLYFRKNRKGEVGRRFAKKKRANHTETVQRSAHQITIPARPYLGLGPHDDERIAKIGVDWLAGKRR